MNRPGEKDLADDGRGPCTLKALAGDFTGVEEEIVRIHQTSTKDKECRKLFPLGHL